MENKLYIVSTPIGNLKDVTFRAVEVLKEVNLIACEDTRVASILLNHYEIKKELISLNAVNVIHRIENLLGRIESGNSCALISDAGTPGISDPGVRLISAAIERGIEGVPIPAPSRLITALTISGLPTNSSVFEGFIPQKKGRQKKLDQLSNEERTIVLYESTYRIVKLLNELNEHMPERLVVVCRDKARKFEETWRGTPSEILVSFWEKVSKGEFVVVIAPKEWKVRTSS